MNICNREENELLLFTSDGLVAAMACAPPSVDASFVFISLVGGWFIFIIIYHHRLTMSFQFDHGWYDRRLALARQTMLSPDITYFDRTAARGSVQNTMEKSESDGRMHNLNWSFRNKGKRLLCSMKSEYGNRFLLNRLIFSQKSVCTAEFAIFARICSSHILLWSRKCLSSSTHHHYHTQMKHARA